MWSGKRKSGPPCWNRYLYDPVPDKQLTIMMMMILRSNRFLFHWIFLFPLTSNSSPKLCYITITEKCGVCLNSLMRCHWRVLLCKRLTAVSACFFLPSWTNSCRSDRPPHLLWSAFWYLYSSNPQLYSVYHALFFKSLTMSLWQQIKLKMLSTYGNLCPH